MKWLRQLFCHHRLVKLGEVGAGVIFGPIMLRPHSIYLCERCEKFVISEQKDQAVYREQCYAPGCEDVGTVQASIIDIKGTQPPPRGTRAATMHPQRVWLCGYHNRHKELIGNETKKPQTPKAPRPRASGRADGAGLAKRSTGRRVVRAKPGG